MKARLWQWLLFSTLCMASPVSAQVQWDSLINAGAYQLVIEMGREQLSRDSNNTEVLLALSKAAFLGNRYALARQCATSLDQKGIDTIRQRQQLMKIFEAEQNYPMAVKFAQKLRTTFPQQSYYPRKLAEFHLASGYATEALHLYQQAYRTEPDDLNNVTAYADLLSKNGQNILADSILTQALISETGNLVLHGMAGRIKMALKDYVAALTHFKIIESQSVLSPWQYKNAGYAYYMTDSLDKAVLYLERSLHNESAPELNYYYLAMVHTKLNHIEEAKNYYQKAVEEGISTHVKSYFHHLSALDAREEKFRDAMDRLDLAYRLFNDPETLFYMGAYAESRYKNKQKAIDYYVKYLESCKNNDCVKVETAQQRIEVLKEYLFMTQKNQ